ncbi:hypothetical protein OS187_00295 [Xanthomonadaceae bacterium JHOS43]|nr:hypothetical protein [Xanthomonadaceae bacterium JHOS43]
MKSTMLLMGVLVAAPAFSQETAYVDMPVQGRENVSYAYADVLRANPTFEVTRVVDQAEECDVQPAATAATDMATRGDASESHDGSDLGSTVMSVQGSSAGDCRIVEVVREERRISGYHVEYRYKGQLYMSPMDHDPGNKLRIRVTVAPAD